MIPKDKRRQTQKKIETSPVRAKRGLTSFRGETSPKEDDKKEQAMARRIYLELGLPSDREMALETMSQLRSLPSHFSDLKARLEQTEKERAEEKRVVMQRKTDTFASEALLQKRWRAEHKSSFEATQTWLAETYLRNPKSTEDMLQPVGTFGLSSAMVMSRYTEGKAPYGVDGRKTWLSDKNKDQGAALSQEALRIQKEQEKSTGKPFGYERALAMAERRHPELVQAYTREVLQKENL